MIEAKKAKDKLQIAGGEPTGKHTEFLNTSGSTKNEKKSVSRIWPLNRLPATTVGQGRRKTTRPLSFKRKEKDRSKW
jgi:hypothetical protein